MVWQSSTNEDTAYPWWNNNKRTPLSPTCYLKSIFCSFSIRKLKVSCDTHMRFWIHYFRPRFLRSRFPRSLQGDLKHIIITFLFQPYHQFFCVSVSVWAGVFGCVRFPAPPTAPFKHRMFAARQTKRRTGLPDMLFWTLQDEAYRCLQSMFSHP